MPRKGPNYDKIEKIIRVLKKNRKGLWIREIARKAGLDKSTVSRYIAKYMQNKIKILFPHTGSRGLTKIVKLRD